MPSSVVKCLTMLSATLVSDHPRITQKYDPICDVSALRCSDGAKIQFSVNQVFGIHHEMLYSSVVKF